MDKDFANLAYQEKLFLKLLKNLPINKQKTVKQALALAKKQHQGQKRSEGIPYIIHPIRVANYLIQKLRITDANFIVAALLHDTIEDGNINAVKIKRDFNSLVAGLVEKLTRPTPPNETEKQKKINKPKKFAELLNSEKNVLLIKSIDLLDNLKSWEYIQPGHPHVKKFPRWIDETEEYYLKIAAKAHPIIYQEMKRTLPKVLKKIRKIHNL